MAYGAIVNGVLTLKQPGAGPGLVQVPDTAICGQVTADGGATFADPTKPLDDRQEARWDAIKAERDRRSALGVKVGAHWFHSDEKSRIQQLGLVMLGANLPAVQWKTLTFSPPPVFVTMTPVLAQGIMVATAQSDTAVFAAAEAHRIAMEASAAPEAYDFSGGWPQSIEDEANAAGIQFNAVTA